MRLAARVLLPGTGWIAFTQLMDLVGLMMDLLGKRFLPRGSLRFPNRKIYSSEAVYCFSLRTYCNNIGHFIKKDALAIFTRLNQRVFIPSRSCLRPHWVRNFSGSSHEPVWCHLWMSVLGILGVFSFFLEGWALFRWGVLRAPHTSRFDVICDLWFSVLGISGFLPYSRIRPTSGWQSSQPNSV